MLKFLADENFNRNVVRQVERRVPQIDIEIAQETEIYGQDDPTVLHYAARKNRILLTHDAKTIPYYAYERILSNLKMLGVILVKSGSEIRLVVEQLELTALFGFAEEFDNQVRYLPLYLKKCTQLLSVAV